MPGLAAVLGLVLCVDGVQRATDRAAAPPAVVAR
ncbi:N-acetylmuramoyl-L-alanine amidase, partial [Streptomyces griseorubiginosus]|nr:N-acetylmuramoyl-L-alanine amidase [Streptomyces griseorubiginosus]